MIHPDDALFDSAGILPNIPVCEHFAGSEKLILKAFALQERFGPVFDVTCDCEDGAPAGQEQTHVQMIGSVISSPANQNRMAGIRIHDPEHPHCFADIDAILERAGEDVAYITIPKANSLAAVSSVIEYIQRRCSAHQITRPVPIHVLIETHGALADVRGIAGLPWVEVLDFGLMDFVSAHYGSIPAEAMRSPGQFEHRLIARAKAEVTAAALAHGVVPAHNVCLDLQNGDQVKADALRARLEFGFRRMWSIHPNQIMPIVEAMRPDFSEVEDGAAILLAATAAEWGPIQYKGELHDRATYRYYWNVLRQAQATGLKIPEAARSAFFD